MLNYLYVILYINNQALKYFTRTLGITVIGKKSYFWLYIHHNIYMFLFRLYIFIHVYIHTVDITIPFIVIIYTHYFIL